MNVPLLGGKVHQRELGNWTIRWESDGEYRHWCSQTRSCYFNGRFIAVCLFNPGSLKGDGENLQSDSTLRILRDVFCSVRYGCLVVNLFDRATPDPAQLFSLWPERDKANCPLIYPFVSTFVVASLRAYGNYGNHPDRRKAGEIGLRIAELETWRAGFDSIDSPTHVGGAPKHVIRWQIERLKETLAQRLSDFAARDPRQPH